MAPGESAVQWPQVRAQYRRSTVAPGESACSTCLPCLACAPALHPALRLPTLYHPCSPLAHTVSPSPPCITVVSPCPPCITPAFRLPTLYHTCPVSPCPPCITLPTLYHCLSVLQRPQVSACSSQPYVLGCTSLAHAVTSHTACLPPSSSWRSLSFSHHLSLSCHLSPTRPSPALG